MRLHVHVLASLSRGWQLPTHEAGNAFMLPHVQVPASSSRLVHLARVVRGSGKRCEVTVIMVLTYVAP